MAERRLRGNPVIKNVDTKPETVLTWDVDSGGGQFVPTFYLRGTEKMVSIGWDDSSGVWELTLLRSSPIRFQGSTTDKGIKAAVRYGSELLIDDLVDDLKFEAKMKRRS